MKSIFLIFTLIFSFIADAQEHFPYKRPELLVGKTVTIMPIGQHAIVQKYRRFYTDKSLSKYYNGARDVSKTALEGRKFNITAVEPNSVEKGFENYWITLKEVAAGETLFYLYSERNKKDAEYYFEVEGGLTLPPDFYCDYIEEMKMPDGTSRYTLTLSAFEVIRSGAKPNPSYTLSLQLFEDATQKLGPLTIIGEDGSKLTIKGTGTYVVSGRSYVGGEVTAKELEALSRFKPIRFEYGGKGQLLMNGEILQKGSACLLTK